MRKWEKVKFKTLDNWITLKSSSLSDMANDVNHGLTGSLFVSRLGEKSHSTGINPNNSLHYESKTQNVGKKSRNPIYLTTPAIHPTQHHQKVSSWSI